LSLRDLMGRTPLHHACLNGNKKAVDLLLDWDAPIEVAGNDGITPIHCAVLSGSIDILKKLLLLQAGADVNADSRVGYTPLLGAVMGGQEQIVGELLRKDVDVNAADEDGFSSIHLA
ncbi:ankyrin repeat protein 4ank, partial [Trichoderma reesei RUT C-30]